ncbi:putative transcription factor WD40-like family [Helianthus annuus]|nr:putative transcription factor WD40-like family [Helianthus annuus]
MEPDPQTLTQFHILPQPTYVDSLRFLPPLSAFDRHIAVASFNSDTSTPTLTLNSITPPTPTTPPTLTPQSSFTPSSRITSLKTTQTPQQNPLIAASTATGSVHILFPNPVDGSFESEVSVPDNVLHLGRITCLDLLESGLECVSVGEDGRVNVISVGDSGLDYRRVVDGKGLVSQFKGNWGQGATSGIIHSIDIHPSRKHTCLAGGSNGNVFAWDLRRPQQPIVLSGVDNGETATCISESDVWEVQYDTFMSASDHAKLSSIGVLPAMICSEDGMLAVIKQGEEPIELLAENCAINCFDIDRHNPSDVICGLEWESIALLTRA